ncbi:MAG: PQQ-binding-like beta-propeller repeat protein, partial [Eubacteriaceae bacterium]|nr:PQQ-binding-like beta-propeller repeat protein [Eubacteriaceae bacterium]
MPVGCTDGALNITGLERFTIRVGNDEIYTDYTVEIHRLKNYKAYVNASPVDANVVITDPSGQSVRRQDDGSYLLTTNYKYTYNITAEGYVGQSGEILRTEEDDYYLDVTLEKSSAAELPDVGAAWKDFRNSDYNLGITDAPTPVSAEEADLLWYTKMGENWSSAASVQIIVDDALIVMSGSVLYKVSLDTGQTLASSEMAAAPDWGYTPPTYARGMIFCPLGKGTIQAFNAETLEPLWIYQDPLKGQSISPIAYSDGYIYTGFWNGEVGDANYVCISITDEDPTKTDEAKTASWTYTSNGGFYWAGAVVLGDYVVVGTDDGTRGFDGDSKLMCFDRHTGETVSSITLSGMGDQRSSIAYDKDSGRVFFTTKNGYLASAMVDTQTGALTDLRSHAFPGSQSTSTPVVYKGRVYLGIGAGIGAAGQFVCADAETLEPIYTVDLLGYPQCSMLLSTAYEEKGELYFYSTYNALPGGITLIKADAAGSSGQAVEIYDAAEAPEYCITSIICGADGTLYYKNDTGYVFAVGVADSSKVEKLIDAIGEVTLGSGDAIASARSAYDALDEDAKAKVDNYQKLLDAEDTLSTLRADAVKAQIDALPSSDELTLDDEASVNSALAAYNALPSDAKAKLPAESKAKLDQAIARMSELRAQRVSDMIADLPEAKDVKLEDEADIRAARRAYSELSDDEKEMVSGLNKLIGAETALQKLKDQKPEGSTKSVTVTINGVTYEVSEATKAAVEAIQKILEPEDPSKSLPEDFRDLTDEQEKEILDAYRLYNALTHDEKLFVNNFSGFEDILEKLGEKYHTDEATGVSVAGSNADLPWNI